MIILLSGGGKVPEEEYKKGVIYWAVSFADREARHHHERGGDYASEWLRSCDLIIRSYPADKGGFHEYCSRSSNGSFN